MLGKRIVECSSFWPSLVPWNFYYINVWLFLAQCGADDGLASRCHPCPHESMGGSRLNAKKSIFVYYRGPLFRCGVGFDSIAGTSVSCSYWLDPHSGEQIKLGHSLSNSFETVRSDGSCVQRNTFWPAVQENFAVMAQDQRATRSATPEGQPVLHDQG